MPTTARTTLSPITEDDATIAAALEDVSVPALVAAVTSITGDPALLRGTVRPRTFVPNDFQGGLEEGELAQLRAQALARLAHYRDSGCPPPPPMDPALLREIMSWMVAEAVNEEYVPMFVEEVNLDGDDSRRIDLDDIPADQRQSLSVLVIGCGQSGLLAGVRLKQAGIPFTIVDKNPGVGGTWLDNTYPGCRVDVGNHFYCYSFEPETAFSEYFSRQPELLAYFQRVMDRWGVGPHVQWSTEVRSMRWDDEAAHWKVALQGADGIEHAVAANVVISAVGQLNRPSTPDIPGLESFGGPVFHTARWDHSIDLSGKRVAMIGAGASGVQAGPFIAETAERLVIFQRSAQWMNPNLRYREAVGAGVAWAMAHIPSYAAWFRFMLLYQASDKALALIKIDPEWDGLPDSANALSDARRRILVDWITQHVGDDEALLAKVIPTYPPMGKRMLQDDGSWLRCLRQDNVELVRDAIVRIEPGAIVTADARFEADVIVMATGFTANEFLSPMEVVGRNGRDLRAHWGSAPAAHLGITVPDFPNLFLMYGPGTNLAHAGSIIFHSECQMQFIGTMLRSMLVGEHRVVEVKQRAHDAYVERLQAELAQTVWAHPSVAHSWYKGPDGRVHVLSPWRLVDYWRMTKHPELDAYSFS